MKLMKLELNDRVKIKAAVADIPEMKIEIYKQEVGRVVGFAGGDYQVRFPSASEPLWFSGSELVEVKQ